ncbi:MAG: hypothetical protein HYV07_04175 [Deltaproteobacteria bacterium]|nr:hypothetical protein [Deltaproteobacteria bacterium]
MAGDLAAEPRPNAPALRRPLSLLLAKLAAFIVAVAALQVVIFSTRRPVEMRTPELNKVQALANAGTDVLFLGDSSIFAEEGNQLNTDTILQSLMPEHKVGLIAHWAFHLGVYAAYFEYVRAIGFRPKYVVVPVNLRSFSASWYSCPEYQFAEITFALRHSSYVARAFLDPLKVFKAFQLMSPTQDEFRRTPVLDGDEKVGVVADFKGPEYSGEVTEAHLRDIIVFHYMNRIDRDHPRAKDLMRLADQILESGSVPVFYVSPVDHESCSTALGDRFDERLAENVEALRGVLNERQLPLLDLSRSVEAKDFNWRPGYPNEHMLEPGRRYLAERLAEHMRARP